MPGLVLEGGTFRPVFSCGVMDALLDNDIMFDYVIGVSAGITYAASYLSRQRERNINILRQYRGDKRYFGARNLLHDHSIFGTDFVFDTIPNQLVPFDWDEFHKYQGKYLVGVTNAKTGRVPRRHALGSSVHDAASDLRHPNLLSAGADGRRDLLRRRSG